MDKSIVHHYRRFRAQQMETYNGESGGSAAVGFHAYAAYESARRHIYFMANLKHTNRIYKKRSNAARKGWKKRRAQGAKT